MDIISETENVNERVAKNLVYYRKAAGLTQAELAQKINYSDKSVSKWESGNGMPDIYILMQLAEIYGVTVNDLVYEPQLVLPIGKKQKPNRLSSSLVMLLAVGLVWLVAITAFVILQILFRGEKWWLIFLYAVVVSAIVVVVLASAYGINITNFLARAVLIWVTITSVYATAVAAIGAHSVENLWMLFLVGIPLEVLDIFWVIFRSVKKKQKKAKAHAEKEIHAGETLDGHKNEQ